MMYTFEYVLAYPGPSVPIIDVMIQALTSDTHQIAQVALVDSGADASIIPLQALRSIQARKVDTAQIQWGSGLSYRVDVYEVALQIGRYQIPKVNAIADRQNGQMILGRDVLNQFIVTLNRLANVVEVSQ